MWRSLHLIFALTAIAFAFTLQIVPAAADRRVALVIGNSAYANTTRLENPSNDAAGLSASLQQLGFEVIEGRDLDKAGMDRMIRSFAEALAGADLGLFFYGGHGMQINGDNYLVPVDAKLTTASALDFEMLRLDVIQRSMERETKTNVIMLDACRDNPLSRNLARALGTRSTAIGRGLAAMESGEGTLISFSTQPGNVALDGAAKNSPYAEALMKHIGAQGEDLPTILINVRNDVMAATAHRQVPWEHSALTAKVYFTAPKPAGPTHDQQVELTFWSSVKDSNSPAVLRTYADRYPKGEFAPIARALIEQYEQQAKANLAMKEEDDKRRDEANKQAEVKRLEEQRRLREISLEEERLRAQQARNEAEAKRIEQQAVTEHAASTEEREKALDEARKAHEAAKRAEEQRLAAVKAADDASKSAAETVDRKRQAIKNSDPAKIAALPEVSKPESYRFDGLWTFTRSVSERCDAARSVFQVRIQHGIVTGPGGKGSLSPSGNITVPGRANSFSGTLRGNTGSGTYSGRCTGTFVAKRN